MNTTPVPSSRLFTFASGGWVLLLTGVVTLALLGWAIAPALMRSVYHPPGDGRNIDTYQFDISGLNIPREEIIPIMIHRDMVPVISSATATGPTIGDATETRWKEMQHRNDPKYGKYLVSDDRVIGVEVNGESRCYPMSVMYVHEVVNDTLGGMPIALVYSMPSDSIVVLDRRVNGKELRFGISGLLYNCDTLLYDTRDGGSAEEPAIGGESLFCPLLFRGVSGPLANTKLTPMSCELTTWREWSAAHPKTTVLDRDLTLAKRYEDASPRPYLRDPKPLRPVNPPPPANMLPAKTPVVVVTAGEARQVFPIPAMDALADKDGNWTTEIGGVMVEFHLSRATQTVTAQSVPPGSIIVMYTFWFAWHAMHPDDPVVVH